METIYNRIYKNKSVIRKKFIAFKYLYENKWILSLTWKAKAKQSRGRK